MEALGNLKLDKFIHASTGGIYSWKHKTLKEEITPLNPGDNYSITKFVNEKQIYFFGEKNSKQICDSKNF